jgi:excisionase family DNA binding protein
MTPDRIEPKEVTMRVEEAAAELGMSLRHLHRLIKSGEIKATRKTVTQKIEREYEVVDVDPESLQEYKRKRGLE